MKRIHNEISALYMGDNESVLEFKIIKKDIYEHFSEVTIFFHNTMFYRLTTKGRVYISEPNGSFYMVENEDNV